MSVMLHQSGYDYAQKLIQNRRCVLDQRSDWTDHKPVTSLPAAPKTNLS
jgi:hypothetical protein